MEKRGFTFIEIMITLAVIAVLFIPMMQLFSYGVGSSAITGETITASNLGRWEMERVKNLSLTTKQIAELGNVWTPPEKEPPLELDETRWRILRTVGSGDPLLVKVEVYLEGNKKPIVTLATMLTDSVWVKEREKS